MIINNTIRTELTSRIDIVLFFYYDVVKSVPLNFPGAKILLAEDLSRCRGIIFRERCRRGHRAAWSGIVSVRSPPDRVSHCIAVAAGAAAAAAAASRTRSARNDADTRRPPPLLSLARRDSCGAKLALTTTGVVVVSRSAIASAPDRRLSG